jgi:NAD(P)H-dependent FMN reductase
MQKILVITGSTRPNRKSPDVAKWFMEIAQGNEAFEFELADLAEINLPMFDEPLAPMFGKYEHEHTKKWNARLDAADGFVIVTPEYNHGYPAALKNAIDYGYHEWARKPVAFISYGVAGGLRATEQLKQVFNQVNAAPINQQVSMNLWMHWQNKLFAPDEQSVNSAKGMLEALEWWGETLKAGREKSKLISRTA